MPSRYHNVEERLEEQRRVVRETRMREWLAEIEAHPSDGFCYFIGSESGRIKIGNSRSPRRRLGELRRASPEKLEFLARTTGGAERESYYHALFADHARGGEWFDRHPDILAEIERLNRGF